MANAPGILTPTIKIPSSIGINRSGFSCPKSLYVTKRVCCSSTSPRPRVPRLVSKGCKLVGCGSALPNYQVSNDDLAKVIDTSDEWISNSTGIRRRRILTGKENMTSLAVEAAQKALEMAKINADDVDLILLCSSTPDDLFGGAPEATNCTAPSNVDESLGGEVLVLLDMGDLRRRRNVGELLEPSEEMELQSSLVNVGFKCSKKTLGCKRNPPAFDIRAACSGFLIGLVSASCYIQGGGFKNVLVIGADSLSRYVDWKDRKTCVLFGDAAGAILVQACDSEEDGLYGFDLHTDGYGKRLVNAGIQHIETDFAFGSNGAALGFSPTCASISHIQMNGQEVFRYVVNVVPESIKASLAKADLRMSDIDWLLVHQGNQRITDIVATKLEFPMEKVISNIANYGNTSAASIPLALDVVVRSGKVKEGQTIMIAGFGAGFTWGSAIVRWG